MPKRPRAGAADRARDLADHRRPPRHRHRLSHRRPQLPDGPCPYRPRDHPGEGPRHHGEPLGDAGDAVGRTGCASRRLGRFAAIDSRHARRRTCSHRGHRRASARAGWRARLELGFANEDSRTRLVRRAHEGPLVVQKPLYPEGEDVCQCIVVHPPGGIAGGDDIELRVDVESGAHAQLTTPGATRWYRNAGADAAQRIVFSVADGGVLEWLPQGTIVFDGATRRPMFAWSWPAMRRTWAGTSSASAARNRPNDSRKGGGASAATSCATAH